MLDPSRPQQVERLADAVGSAQLPGVGSGDETASRAIVKARANGAGPKSASSAASPNETTPRPAKPAASSARASASAGGRLRMATSMRPNPMPSRSASSRPVRTMNSVTSSGVPNCGT